MNIIETENLRKVYPSGDGELLVLNDISIQISEASLVMIQGRSGSGKTTLLNMLSALDTPTSGDIVFEDKRYSALKSAEIEKIRRNRMGFVFQSVALIPMMSAYENIDFGLRTAGVKKGRDTIIRNSLENVGLLDRMRHMPSQMSGGEQQRVAIARAMAHKPSVIFADEPTGALDTDSGISIVKLFKKLTETQNITIIMTTHDMGLLPLADKVFSIEDGIINGD